MRFVVLRRRSANPIVTVDHHFGSTLQNDNTPMYHQYTFFSIFNGQYPLSCTRQSTPSVSPSSITTSPFSHPLPKTDQKTVVLFMSHPRDDSYTPSKICIKAGTSTHDLQDVRICEFQKPDGWIGIPLRPMEGGGDEGGEEGSVFFFLFLTVHHSFV